ncbi:MAG: lipopolysaccharide kinase InaA family protein [Planctomycetota bacterium]|jgi:hypothetical protein
MGPHADDLHPDDRRQLQEWWTQCCARPGQLPADLEVVQQKIVRAVGHGELPQAGSVYVKAMWFPRAKDKLRYAFRRLPGVHEARMLGLLGKAGVPCPKVLFVRGRRVMGVPRLSLLVVGDLHPAATAPAPRAMIDVAARLAAAGVFHPDLNPGNFLLLESGEVAVLDLQSARQRSGAIDRRERRRMAAKLLLHLDPNGSSLEDVVESGLLHADDGPLVLDNIAEMQRNTQLTRIRRCFMESTTFTVGWRWNGTLFRRRSVADGGTWVEGGAELVRYWIGDRSQEVLANHAPVLGGLFRRSALFPGKHKLYIPGGGQEPLRDAVPRLLEGHAKYLELLRGGLRPASEADDH